MLQIACGKLFSQPPAFRNRLRGILSSNMLIEQEDAIETAAGRILPTSFISDLNGGLVYELDELMEHQPAPGVIVSSGIEPYIYDFAAVVSLALNVTCTVSADETFWLTTGMRNAAIGSPLNSIVPRVFDREIVITDAEVAQFVTFVKDLIDLKRKFFLQAMRAIRTYITALRELSVNLAWSYILLVASIESLAQGYDEFELEWTDYDPAKRTKLDKALENADEETARKIRATLLEMDKPGAGTRFREYVKQNLNSSYFRGELVDVQYPASRSDLDQALREAYSLRSGFVHQLRELPNLHTLGANLGETLEVSGKTQFTFRGLVRIARHLILGFVRERPKLTKEPYYYSRERYGIVYAPLSAEYWIANTTNLTLSDGQKRLNGYLNQLSACMSNEKNAMITDIRPVLAKAEQLMITGNEESRRAFLALYRIFNLFVPCDQRMENLRDIENRYSSEIETPCIENLLVYMMWKQIPNWKLLDYQYAIETYFEQRNGKYGLKLPRTFEAAVLLFYAEQHRLAGNFECTLKIVSKATECHPGYKPLQQLEEKLNITLSIDWREVVFPNSVNPDT
ncbi:MAG: hypothetical protein OXH84_00340 [Gammaproteobacteria bacterium]|nr:hypothetical protein [Gammaproteobacteria bacterium]